MAYFFRVPGVFVLSVHFLSLNVSDVDVTSPPIYSSYSKSY